MWNGLIQGVDEVLFNEQGKAWGIKTGNEVYNLLSIDRIYLFINC
jgi:hypothetical protein